MTKKKTDMREKWLVVRMYSVYHAYLEHWNGVLYHQSAILVADEELIIYVALRKTAQGREAFIQR